MTTIEAIGYLGYESLNDIDIDDLKIKYKKLARKHHPDLFQSNPEEQEKHENIFKQINEAYNTLLTVVTEVEQLRKFEQASKRQDVFAVIPMEAMLNVYNDKEIKLKSKMETENEEVFILKRGNIKTNRIYLYIECIVEVYGVEQLFTRITPITMDDTYEIHCDIRVPEEELNNAVDIRIKTFNKDVKLKLEVLGTRLRLKYDNNVALIVDITKKILSN